MDLLQRALDILEFVCVSGSASADETSEALGIPKSTVYRLLTALRERDKVLLAFLPQPLRETTAARFTGDAFPAWASAVCEMARCISRDLGYPMVLSPAITVTDQPFYQGVCKAAMELVGKPVGKAREPMENLTDDEKQELRGILRMMGASVVC